MTLPLGLEAPVKGVFNVVDQAGSNLNTLQATGGSSNVTFVSQPSAGFDLRARGDTAAGDLYADLSDATAATINQLRQSFQVQRLLERDARGGSRYTELLRAHFGVLPADSRLQRPSIWAVAVPL